MIAGRIERVKSPSVTYRMKPGPAQCIISVSQLRDLAEKAKREFGDEYDQKNMYDVVERVVKPACAKKGKPYALIVNDQTPFPDVVPFVFITHAWAENFKRFVRSVVSIMKVLQEHYSAENPDEAEDLHIWICAFALEQSDDPTKIVDQLGTDPSKAPFTKALRKAAHYVMVRNLETDIYSRIWCVWEIYCALEFGLLSSDKFRIAGPSKSFMAANCPDFHIHMAHAHDPNDKNLMLNHIQATPGIEDHINLLVSILRQV